MTLIKLSTMAAVAMAVAAFTTDADAGSCRRSYRRSYVVPTRPFVPPAIFAPGAPGALPPGVAPGTDAAGGGAGQGQDVAGKADQNTTQSVNVPVGATVTLPGSRGDQMGEVNLILGEVRLPLTILDWNESGITVTLPDMAISSATQAQIEIKSPGSSSAETLSIQLEPLPTVLIQDAPEDVPPPAPAPIDADVTEAQPEAELADN